MNDRGKEEGVIEVIGSYFGSAAEVTVELRTIFPGVGGTIKTSEGALTAIREEFNIGPKNGHRRYLTHSLIKKLEDYFKRKGFYNYAHIPRPFGSISKEGENRWEAYFYEWAEGNEGFMWKIAQPDGEGGVKKIPVMLNDWNTFIGVFSEAGIDLQYDTTDPHNQDKSKNIIYQFPVKPSDTGMSSVWKRIDFGPESIRINYEQLSKFLHDNRQDMINILRNERYRMLELMLDYLTEGKEKMKGENIGILEMLIGDFRHKTLLHYLSRGSGTLDKREPYFDGNIESVL